MSENSISRAAGVPAGVRAVKEWTTKVRLVESASALSGGAAAAAAAASEQVPFAEVALQQLNISDRIRLLRPEGRRSTYREIHVLRLPVPAAPLPASPAPSPVAPLQQSDTPAAASSAAGAQELEAPSLPNTAAILPRAISNSPPSLQSARRALRAWTPQEGIPERALLPSSPTPSLVKVPCQRNPFTPIEGVMELRGIDISFTPQSKRATHSTTCPSTSAMAATDSTPRLQSGWNCAPPLQSMPARGAVAVGAPSRLSAGSQRPTGCRQEALAQSGFGLTVSGFAGLMPVGFDDTSNDCSQEESPVEGLLDDNDWDPQPGVSRLYKGSTAADAHAQRSGSTNGFSFGNGVGSRRDRGSQAPSDGGEGVTNSFGPQPPTAFGPQQLQLSPAAAAPVVSPIFAGLHRNRWTSRSFTPGTAPTSVTPEPVLPATSIEHAASARQTRSVSPKKPSKPTPSAGAPSSAHRAARPVQTWLLVHDVPQSSGAALVGHGDSSPSGGNDTCGGGDSGWCGSEDEGMAHGSTLQLNLSPPAATSILASHSIASPPGLLDNVATSATRLEKGAISQKFMDAASPERADAPAKALLAERGVGPKNARLRRQFQGRKSLAGDGMVSILGTNQKPRRRSTRATHQPLRFELGEHKCYERNHKSMPTVTDFVYVEDKPFWPGPTPPASGPKRSRSKAAPSKQPSKKARTAPKICSTTVAHNARKTAADYPHRATKVKEK